MNVTPSYASSPLMVQITGGKTASAPPSPSSVWFNAATGALIFTYSDGSQISVPGLAQAIAASLGEAHNENTKPYRWLKAADQIHLAAAIIHSR